MVGRKKGAGGQLQREVTGKVMGQVMVKMMGAGVDGRDKVVCSRCGRDDPPQTDKRGKEKEH
jgi:hypothetical protein